MADVSDDPPLGADHGSVKKRSQPLLWPGSRSGHHPVGARRAARFDAGVHCPMPRHRRGAFCARLTGPAAPRSRHARSMPERWRRWPPFAGQPSLASCRCRRRRRASNRRQHECRLLARRAHRRLLFRRGMSPKIGRLRRPAADVAAGRPVSVRCAHPRRVLGEVNGFVRTAKSSFSARSRKN